MFNHIVFFSFFRLDQMINSSETQMLYPSTISPKARIFTPFRSYSNSLSLQTNAHTRQGSNGFCHWC